MCFLPIFLSLLISFYIRWENPSFIGLSLNIQACGIRNLCQLYDWQNRCYFLYFFLIVLNWGSWRKLTFVTIKKRVESPQSRKGERRKTPQRLNWKRENTCGYFGYSSTNHFTCILLWTYMNGHIFFPKNNHKKLWIFLILVNRISLKFCFLWVLAVTKSYK